MLPPKVRAVFIKELRDALRDRRTVLATVVVPILLYPIMLLGIAEIFMLAQAKLQKEVYTVAVPPGTRAFFEEELQKLPKEAEAPKALTDPKPMGAAAEVPTEALPVPTLAFLEMEGEQAKTALSEGKVRAAVFLPLPDELRKQLGAAEAKPVPIEIYFDSAEHRSADAKNRLTALLNRLEKIEIERRLNENKLGLQVLQPLQLKTTSVAKAEKLGGFVMGSMLPILFIMMIIAGAMNPAIDMTAGEKERSTLETLIGAPVRPIEIITGKFLAVGTLSMGNAALNVLSFALSFSLLPLSKMANMAFPWAALPLTLLLLIPLTLFFSGLMLAACSFAANQKEAQIYCLPIYLVPVLGMLVVGMPGIDLEGPLLLLPVINTALLIKELFLSHGTVQQILFVFCSTCLYAAGAVGLAARIFAREEVLFSAQGNLRLFLKRRFFKPSIFPRSSDSLLLIALLYPANFYVQMLLQKLLVDFNEKQLPVWKLVIMVLVPLWGLLLGVPLLAAWYLKLNLRETFIWRRCSLSAVLAAVLLAVGVWPVVHQLIAWQSHFWPLPSFDDAQMKGLTQMASSWPGLALCLFLIAVTPAICEEHLFRGFLQQGVTRSSKWFGILLVGVIFGAYHSPVFKQPVIMLVGVLLAYLAYQSQSLWPGVLMHFVYNGLGIVGPTLVQKAGIELAEGKAGEPLPNVPLQILLPGVLAFIVGLLLIPRRRPAGLPEQAEPVPPLPAEVQTGRQGEGATG